MDTWYPFSFQDYPESPACKQKDCISLLMATAYNVHLHVLISQQISAKSHRLTEMDYDWNYQFGGQMEIH